MEPQIFSGSLFIGALEWQTGRADEAGVTDVLVAEGLGINARNPRNWRDAAKRIESVGKHCIAPRALRLVYVEPWRRLNPKLDQFALQAPFKAPLSRVDII